MSDVLNGIITERKRNIAVPRDQPVRTGGRDPRRKRRVCSDERSWHRGERVVAPSCRRCTGGRWNGRWWRRWTGHGRVRPARVFQRSQSACNQQREGVAHGEPCRNGGWGRALFGLAVENVLRSRSLSAPMTTTSFSSLIDLCALRRWIRGSERTDLLCLLMARHRFPMLPKAADHRRVLTTKFLACPAPPLSPAACVLDGFGCKMSSEYVFWTRLLCTLTRPNRNRHGLRNKAKKDTTVRECWSCIPGVCLI